MVIETDTHTLKAFYNVRQGRDDKYYWRMRIKRVADIRNDGGGFDTEREAKLAAEYLIARLGMAKVCSFVSELSALEYAKAMSDEILGDAYEDLVCGNLFDLSDEVRLALQFREEHIAESEEPLE